MARDFVTVAVAGIDRQRIAAIQQELKAGGYSASISDAIRYALRKAAPLSIRATSALAGIAAERRSVGPASAPARGKLHEHQGRLDDASAR